MHDSIGRTFVDKISGLKGVATGRVEYLTGCNQLLIQPRSSDGRPIECHWLDEQRLDREDSVKRVVLDNGDAPGFDREAPKR